MTINNVENIKIIKNEIADVHNDISTLYDIPFKNSSSDTVLLTANEIVANKNSNNTVTNTITNKLKSISNTMEKITPEFYNMKTNMITNNLDYSALNEKLNTAKNIRDQNIIKSEANKVENLQIADAIETSEIVHKNKYSNYLRYLLFMILILAGSVIMFWFPQKGNLDIFIFILSTFIIAYLYTTNNNLII